MLKRVTTKTINATITIEVQGERQKFDITYHNRSEKEFQQIEAGTTLAEVVIFLVESWESEFPLTKEGVIELEGNMPGMCMIIIDKYREAKAARVVKN